MKKQFEILKKTREHLLAVISDLSPEQLNEIPAGFNNNIAWNFGHMIAGQQAICYFRAGLPLFIDEKFFESYKSGTRPASSVDNIELGIIKQLFLTTIDQFEADYQQSIFLNYTPWTNRYGIEFLSINDLIPYLIFHEGLHLGYIMALKHLVKK